MAAASEDDNSLMLSLRAKFLDSVKDGSKDFDQRDIERFQEDDQYVNCFLFHKKNNIDDAFNLVNEVLKWRKTFGIYDINESMLDPEALKIGAIYFHSNDKEGHKILFFMCKLYKRDAEKLPTAKKLVAYWFEKHHSANPCDPITILFDMTDTGLSNLDMDLIKFMIACFRTHFPGLLNMLLVYNMPFILNAAWKIIKGWLPSESADRIRFVGKSDITQYIEPDKLFAHMGGKDTFQYVYAPNGDTAARIGETSKKKVTFAEESISAKATSGESAPRKSILSVSSSSSSGHAVSINSLSQKRRRRDENSFIGELLTISPAEELEFEVYDLSKETLEVIALTNQKEKPVAYKVKTTAPEKYRVRPGSGIILPNSCVEVKVYIQPGNQTVVRDKFLVLAMYVDNENKSGAELTELFRNPRNVQMEHRLRCSIRPFYIENQEKQAQNRLLSELKTEISRLQASVDQLSLKQTQLVRTTRFVATASFLLLLLVIVLLLFVVEPTSVTWVLSKLQVIS